MIRTLQAFVIKDSKMSRRPFLDIEHKKTFKQRSISLEDVFEYANAREINKRKDIPNNNVPQLKVSDDTVLVNSNRPLLSCTSDDFDNSSDTDKESPNEVTSVNNNIFDCVLIVNS